MGEQTAHSQDKFFLMVVVLAFVVIVGVVFDIAIPQRKQLVSNKKRITANKKRASRLMSILCLDCCFYFSFCF